MSPEQAIEYALGNEGDPAVVSELQEESSAERQRVVLTHREREVAVLVARGLTNRQIASELSISEHTIATHVREILKKSAFHSRAQIATWVTEGQLLT